MYKNIKISFYVAIISIIIISKGISVDFYQYGYESKKEIRTGFFGDIGVGMGKIGNAMLGYDRSKTQAKTKTKNDTKDISLSYSGSFNNSIIQTLELGYEWEDYGISFNIYHLSFKGKNYEIEHELTSNDVLLKLYQKFNNVSYFTPYVGLGIGFDISKYEGKVGKNKDSVSMLKNIALMYKDNFLEENDNLLFKANINSLAFLLNTGIQYNISKNMSLLLDYSIVVSNRKIPSQTIIDHSIKINQDLVKLIYSLETSIKNAIVQAWGGQNNSIDGSDPEKNPFLKEFISLFQPHPLSLDVKKRLKYIIKKLRWNSVTGTIIEAENIDVNNGAFNHKLVCDWLPMQDKQIRCRELLKILFGSISQAQIDAKKLGIKTRGYETNLYKKLISSSIVTDFISRKNFELPAINHIVSVKFKYYIN